VKRVPGIQKFNELLGHINHRCNNFDGQTEPPSRPHERGNGKGASVTIDVKATVLTALIGGPSVIVTLLFAAPAMADPATADPVAPNPVIPFAPPAAPVDEAPAPAPAPLAVAAPLPAPVTPAPAPGPAPDGTVQAAAADPTTPRDGMPHLSSPENLPLGTTDTPPDASQSRGLGYLRDIWHAYQTQEVSGRDALLLLTQRPMDAYAAPPPGMPANPTPPLPPDAAPALAPEPAPLLPAPEP
jgi:resuscitation-promoting factor RpfA